MERYIIVQMTLLHVAKKVASLTATNVVKIFHPTLSGLFVLLNPTAPVHKRNPFYHPFHPNVMHMRSCTKHLCIPRYEKGGGGELECDYNRSTKI